MGVIGSDSFKDTNLTLLQDHTPDIGGPWIGPSGPPSGTKVLIHSRSAAYDLNGTGSDTFWLYNKDNLQDGYIQASLFSFRDVWAALIARVQADMTNFLMLTPYNTDTFLLWEKASGEAIVISKTWTWGMVAKLEFSGSKAYAYFDGVLGGSINSSLGTDFYGFLILSGS